MQDKSAGDIGDFGKYGLLHELSKQAGPGIILGINWYKVTRGEKNSDGKHIDYLKPDADERYRKCFPDIYGMLQKLVNEKSRSIARIVASGVLPKGTACYSKEIPCPITTSAERLSSRLAWFKESLNQLDPADIIFLDPDNGISPDQSQKAKPNAIKYVFPDEIEAYYKNGKSVVIYNHRDRSRQEDYHEKIKSAYPPNYRNSLSKVMALSFHKVSHRDYIFVVQERHDELIKHTIEKLAKNPYDFLFEPYLPGS